MFILKLSTRWKIPNPENYSLKYSDSNLFITEKVSNKTKL